MAFNVSAVKALATQGFRLARKQAPTIMMACGVISFGVTLYTGYGCATEAEKLLAETEEEKGEGLTLWEKALIFARTCWKVFLLGLITLAFFCGAHKISLSRQAALSAAYAMTVSDFDEYKAKASELFGEKKATDIQDAIARERIAAFDPIVLNQVPGTGPLWIDGFSNTPFRGDLETIRHCINDMNDDLYKARGKASLSGEITMNDLYYSLSASLRAPQLGRIDWGDKIGFRADLTGPIDITGSNITYDKAPNGEPCGYIHFKPTFLEDVNPWSVNY